MINVLQHCRHLIVGVAILMSGYPSGEHSNAFGQGKDQAPLWTPRPLASGEVPLPDRIVRSDIVVLGRVVAIEPKDVEAVRSLANPYKLDYRIAVVKVQEVIHGKKDVKTLRVGFVSPDQDKKLDKTGKAMPPLSPVDFVSIKLGQDGLFFLKKHPQGDFFVNPMLIGGFLPSNDSTEFTKRVENSRRLEKMLERPLEALKAENALNRYLAAVMLVNRYRLHGAKASKLPEMTIDAEESKLLLRILAEADWKNVNEAISSSIYPPHPYRIFLQLGVAKKDGYEPPINAPDFRETLTYTQGWIRNNQEKYRIQRFSAGAK
jgi:hypothetical protein